MHSGTALSSAAFWGQKACRHLKTACWIALFLGIALSIPARMHAQSTEKLKPVTSRTGTRPKITEHYTVRMSDGIREGQYTRSRGKALVQRGHYQNGMRDSLWTDYALDGQKIAEGRMNEDRKTGVWAYFSFAGDTIQLFDYDRGRMLRYDREKEMASFSNGFLAAESLPDTTLAVENIKLPAYIGGMTMILHIFTVDLSYPVRDLENGVQGIVLLGFTVDKEGRTRDLRILKSVSPGIDEEALRLGALLGDNWIPGEMEGDKVDVRFTMPLQFKLD